MIFVAGTPQVHGSTLFHAHGQRIHSICRTVIVRSPVGQSSPWPPDDDPHYHRPMTIFDPWLLAFSITTLLLLGATSGLLNSELWMSEPLVCAVAGILLGPVVLGFIQIDPGDDLAARAVFREAARVTLAITALASAMRLPRRWLKRQWRGLSVALGPGMLAMWAAGSAIVWCCLGLPLLDCALIGAVLAPTDPVLSAPVVSSPLARRMVPYDLRHAINAESGINDGLVQSFVMIPVFVILAAMSGDRAHGIGDWLFHVLVIEVGSAVVLGAAAGHVASLCLHWAGEHPDTERSSLLTIALALTLATLTGLQAIGGNGVLGAFVAGAVLNEGLNDNHEEHQEHFNEAIARFFDLPIMFLLGALVRLVSHGLARPGFRRRHPAVPSAAGLAAAGRVVVLDPSALAPVVRRLVRAGRCRRPVLCLQGPGRDRDRHGLAGGEPRRRRFGHRRPTASPSLCRDLTSARYQSRSSMPILDVLQPKAPAPAYKLEWRLPLCGTVLYSLRSPSPIGSWPFG